MQSHTDIVATGWVALLPKSWLPWLLLARVDRPIGIWLLFLPGLYALWFRKSLNEHGLKTDVDETMSIHDELGTMLPVAAE